MKVSDNRRDKRNDVSDDMMFADVVIRILKY